MRILSVEDDAASAQVLELMLRSEGFNVATADCGEEGVDLGKLYDYDAIILDLTLPDMSGFDVIKQLRTAKIPSAIIVLTAPIGINGIVRALSLGADDFMTKPFHKDELVARIRAVVRRRKGHAQSVISVDNLVVNLDSRTVTVDGQHIYLTSKEYAMLELLALRKGMTISKEQFLTHIYGGRDEPELKIIDVFICKLRKKLRLAGADIVETVWGQGYVLRGSNLPEIPSPSLAPEITAMRDSPSLVPSLRDLI